MNANRLLLAGSAVVIACVSAWMGARYGSRSCVNAAAAPGRGDGAGRQEAAAVAGSSHAVRVCEGSAPLPCESGGEVAEAVDEEVVQRSKHEDEVAAIAAELAAALDVGDEAAVAEIRHNLAVYRKQTLLNALRGLVRHGTPEQRRNALYALALSFGAGSAKMRTSVSESGVTTKPDDADLGVVGDGLPESPDELERQAHRTHDIVCAVGDGLEDNDPSVRQAAFDAMMALESEERGVLAQQILSGENVEMKRRLLAEFSGSEDRQDLMLSISALEDEDPSVRSMAEGNVKSATGQDLKTQDEALAWVESQTAAEEADVDPGADVDSKSDSVSEAKDKCQDAGGVASAPEGNE